VDDLFEFVEQFLGAADAKCGNEDGAMAFEGLLDDGFESLSAVLPVFMKAVAVGAFQHQDVGALR